MKRHDNTLYVTTQRSYLARDGTNLVVRVNREEKFRAPVNTFGGIVCFGNVSCSPFFMGLCGREGVGLTFLSENGRYLARVVGPQSGNVLLRRSQHRLTADPSRAAPVAANIVSAKIANCRTVLMRALRDHGARLRGEGLSYAVRRLAQLLRELQQPMSLERIRGVEGEAAQVYFGVFNSLILVRGEGFAFTRRTRRPPLDNVNALLSFVYALLTNDVVSACEGVGLDPQMGFLHVDRPGRPSLALDLVEELRPVIADRLVLSLINRQQVNAGGFRRQPAGAVEMADETRKAVLVAYQKRKADALEHPFLREKVTVGLLPHVQARLLARFLRGDLDAYPPFFWR